MNPLRPASLTVLAVLLGIGIAADAAPAQLMPGNGSVTRKESPGWEVVPSPNAGPQADGNTLLAVDARPASDAWAVGARPNQSAYLTQPLVLHWNGASWSVASTPLIAKPTARLNGVAAVSASDAWAVGYADNPQCLCRTTLVEHWDGAAWKLVPSPNPGIANELAAV